MPDDSATSSSSSGSLTLGRLGGLAPGEADRGEKALWLSGGGYRAALFHLGALTRLNELGILAQTGTVGAVSGGSIVAALLATRVSWPLDGGYREWPERVAEPMRAIARRNARARAFLRRPFPGAPSGAELEERYARELVGSLGGEPARGPRFVFGASGLILSGLAAGWEECVEWSLDSAVHPPGYEPGLVAEVIAGVRTDLDAFGEAEQAVLENHGYLLADAALRERGLVAAMGIEPGPPQPPHPRWMNAERVRAALVASARRTAIGRLRPRRANRGGRSLQPASPELTALLNRHRPLLQYDSLESFRADSAATICGLVAPGRCNGLYRGDGTLIAATAAREGEARARARLPAPPTARARLREAPAGCCGRGAGARPGAASSSRPTAPAAPASTPSGGTRPSSIARPGRRAGKSSMGRRIGPPAAGGRWRGSSCGGRGSWRWSRIASGSRGRERRRRASLPPRSTPAKAPAQRTRCRSKDARGPSPCRCRAGGSGRGCGASAASDRGVAGATVAVLFA